MKLQNPLEQSAPANATHLGGDSEQEDQVGRSYPPPAFQLAATAAPPPDEQGAITGKAQFPEESPIQRAEEGKQEGVAEAAVAIHKAFHGSRFSEDEDGALAQIQGKSVDFIRQLRPQYFGIEGQQLEHDFRKYCNRKQTDAAMAIIYPAMPLKDRLKFQVKGSGIFQREDEGTMLHLLEEASPDDIQGINNDPDLLVQVKYLLEKSLGDPDDLFKASLILEGNNPEARYNIVKKFLPTQNGWLNDDESSVYNALLELPASYRKRLWNEESQIFSYLDGWFLGGKIIPGSEVDQVRKMCLGTDATALKTRMEIATKGLGTDDDAVGIVAEKTGEALGREKQLNTMIHRGVDENGQPLSPEKIAELEAELANLGGIQSQLLDPEFNKNDKLKGGSFLEMLHDDVNPAEFQAFVKEMGVMPYDQAKIQILEAFKWYNDDEDRVYKAFNGLEEDLRNDLMKDPQIVEAFEDHLNTEENKVAQDFADQDHYKMTLYNLKEAKGVMKSDKTEIFRLLTTLNETDRKTFESDPLYDELLEKNFLTGPELEVFTEVMATGKMPFDKGIDLALYGGNPDRFEDNPHLEAQKPDANSRMLTNVIQAMPPGKRTRMRIGYFCDRTGASPVQIAEKYAGVVGEFRDLESKMKDTLSGDEMQSALNQILGDPTYEEILLEGGKELAAKIMLVRVKEQASARDSDHLNRFFMDMFSSKGNIEDLEEIEFRSLYIQAMENGSISTSELLALGNDKETYDEAHKDYVDASDRIAAIAGTVAAITASIVVTIVTVGTGAPAAVGIIAAGVTSTSAQMIASEVIGGSHYDSFGKDGQQAIKEGIMSMGVDALLMGAGKGLMRSFSALVNKSGKSLTQSLGKTIHNIAGSTVAQSGKKMVGDGIEEAIDSVLSGIVMDTILTAQDEEVWMQKSWEVLYSFGKDIVANIPSNAAMGMASGMVNSGLEKIGSPKDGASGQGERIGQGEATRLEGGQNQTDLTTNDGPLLDNPGPKSTGNPGPKPQRFTPEGDEWRYNRYKNDGGDLSFEAWKKRSRGGRSGGPGHQAIQNKLKSEGYFTEHDIGNRSADAYKPPTDDSKGEIHQIGGLNERGDPIARERDAINDILNSPEYRGEDIFFWDKTNQGGSPIENPHLLPNWGQR